MSTSGAYIRLAIFAIVILAVVFAQRAGCPSEQRIAALSQTASVGGVLAEAGWDDPYDDPYVEYDSLDDEWCPPYAESDVGGGETLYYGYGGSDDPEYDEWYEEYYEVPYSYPSVSYTPVQGTYTSVVPLGIGVGAQTAPTTITPSVSVQVPQIRFDVVPLGVSVGGIQTTYKAPERPLIVVPPLIVPAPVHTALPACSLSATPIAIGNNTIIFRWSSSNAVLATLSDVGAVPLQSSYYPVSMPYGSRAYTLTVQDALGRSAQCSTYAQVLSAPTVVYQEPWCSIVVQPASAYEGDQVVLSWASTHATAASLAEFGSVGTVGTYSLTASESRAYAMRVQGPGGATSCTAYLSVSKRPAPTPSAPTTPTCSLTADAATIFTSASTTLRWNTTRAESATLSGFGPVKTTGSMSVAPSSSQTYTLTAKGAGGTRSCKVTVSVASTSACTITCNGITYECAPVGTPVGVQCPAQESSSGGLWDWIKGLFR